LNHVFYSDGNAQKISWVIQNDDSSFIENREHVDMYKGRITNIQSKYIALHVGLFWGIGTFIIKNEDTIKIKIDEKTMFDQFTTNSKIKDSFIQKRLQFIRQLIDQRKLKIEFEIINQDENIAKNNI
jgi:hypothetical protein